MQSQNKRDDEGHEGGTERADHSENLFHSMEVFLFVLLSQEEVHEEKSDSNQQEGASKALHQSQYPI